MSLLAPLHAPLLFKPRSLPSSSSSVSVQASAPSTKTRRKRKSQRSDNGSLSLLTASFSAEEKNLRLAFMEELMKRARDRDHDGVSDVIYDMIAAGVSPGPRSFHGLVISHTLNGDLFGAMQSLKRELSCGLRPLHETFLALVRLSAAKGLATRGLEILAAMEKFNYYIRPAWVLLVEELLKARYLEDANMVFLKGLQGGLRAPDELYDRMIVEDCKAGDHSNAFEISCEMEAAGRPATTFHYNCLLSVQATCGIPEIAFSTYENMEYAGEDYMKPDTETYNLVFQAYTRAKSYHNRVEDVVNLLGMMMEDHKRVQPNAKTYAILVECFTKYSLVGEAIRHFRALKNIEGGTKVLYNEGNFGDPLSLYLRALCREGRIVNLLEALEAMAKDNHPIPPRAMILNKKYRTLVSSWIEPLEEEAELGHEIDYIARYVADGGLTGERKRWVPQSGRTPLDPDAAGFVYSPIETSFKQKALEDWKIYHWKIFKFLKTEGITALGDVSESDYERVLERLRGRIKGPERKIVKPKAASKMLVSELREELEAQGLPVDGTRTVLYQRVQKARRINRSRNRPLWVPPVEEKEEEVDGELDELISRITVHEGDTEFWKRRFLGEGVSHLRTVDTDELDDVDDAKDIEDEEAGEEEEEAGEEEEEAGAEEEADDEEAVEVEVERTETQDADRIAKNKESEAKSFSDMMGFHLLKDLDQPTTTSKKPSPEIMKEYDPLDAYYDWLPDDAVEAYKELRERRLFTEDDIYTIADVWGWSWEVQVYNKPPQKWSQEWEVDLAIKIMLKVIELGGTPTIGDCAMILRAAIRAPMPSTFLKILQTAHSLGYVFGSPLYDEVISLCLNLGELDAAIAIVADMETTGITVPDETLDRVIAAKKGPGDAADGTSV